MTWMKKTFLKKRNHGVQTTIHPCGETIPYFMFHILWFDGLLIMFEFEIVFKYQISDSEIELSVGGMVKVRLMMISPANSYSGYVKGKASGLSVWSWKKVNIKECTIRKWTYEKGVIIVFWETCTYQPVDNVGTITYEIRYIQFKHLTSNKKYLILTIIIIYPPIFGQEMWNTERPLHIGRKKSKQLW